MAAEANLDAANSPSTIPYRPLDVAHREVRFLQARRCDVDRHITLTLKHFSLEQRGCPRFIAFSYVWGEPKLHPEPVTADGVPCQVLESIHPILALICDHEVLQNEALFWIDYLCINQSDPAERAAQVTLMGGLYRQAFRTIVWLGESTPDVAGAMTTLRKIPKRRSERELDPLLLHSVTPAQWDAVGCWMALPWWTRVWTLQEFLIPDRLVFHCGEESMTKQRWSSAIGALYDLQSAGMVLHKAFGNHWARRRLLEYYDDEYTLRNQMGLFALMAYVGYYNATDDRDRIYAMLGICKEVDRQLVGPPDYSTPVNDVYIGLARQFILTHRSLDIICFSALFNGARPAAAKGEEVLPSWVPDWRRWADRASRPSPSMVSEPNREFIGNFRPDFPGHGIDSDLKYRASGEFMPEFLFSDNSRSLTCQGVALGHIDGLGPVHHPSPDADANPCLHLVQSTSRANAKLRETTPAVSDAVLQALERSLCLDRANRYLASKADPGSYAHELQRALAASRGAGLPPPPEEDKAIVDWVAANHSLRVQGAMLREHLDAARPPPDEAHSPGDYGIWRAAETTVGEWPWDCRLVVTEGGILGMAPRAAGRGDLVVVLVGCSVPVVLRRVDGGEERRFVVVGECFMPGFMDGEALEGGKLEDVVLV